MWLKRLEQYGKLARKIMEQYPAPPGSSTSDPLADLDKHLRLEGDALNFELGLCVGEDLSPAASTIALSLLEALESSKPYRCGFSNAQRGAFSHASIARLRKAGDLASALAMQEANVFGFWSSGHRPHEQHGLLREVNKYLDIYEEAAERYSKLHSDARLSESISLPPLHNLLLLAKQRAFPFLTCPIPVTESIEAEARDMLGRTLLHLALDLEFQWPDIRDPLNPLRASVRVPDMANKQDGLGRLPLLIACATKCQSATDILFHVTENRSLADRFGRTVMHHAVVAGNRDFLAHLGQCYADCAIEDASGLTPLGYAMNQRDFGMIEEFCKIMALTQTNTSELTNHLRSAVMSQDMRLATMLLDNGVSPHVRISSGLTLLSYAVKMGYYNTVQAILAWKPSPSYPPPTNLCFEDATEGAHTPLMHAAVKGHTDIARNLIAHHYWEEGSMARLDASERVNGWTALFYAAQGGFEDIIEALLDKSVDMETLDHNGYTAMHYAVAEGHHNVVRKFISYDGDRGRKLEHRWRTALLGLAEEKYHSSIITMLRDWKDSN